MGVFVFLFSIFFTFLDLDVTFLSQVKFSFIIFLNRLSAHSSLSSLFFSGASVVHVWAHFMEYHKSLKLPSLFFILSSFCFSDMMNPLYLGLLILSFSLPSLLLNPLLNYSVIVFFSYMISVWQFLIFLIFF